VRDDSPESRSLGMPKTGMAALSPDTDELLMFQVGDRDGDGKGAVIARMPLGGGAPRPVADAVYEADWGPEGREIAALRLADGKARLEYPLGTMLYETAGLMSSVRVAPDGAGVAFLDHPIRGDDRGAVALVTKDGKRRVLSDGWASLTGLAFDPDGDAVWFSGTRLGGMAALFRIGLENGDEPQRMYAAPQSLRLEDIGRDGRILLATTDRRMRAACFVEGEPRPKDISVLDLSLVTDLSADGKLALIVESGEGGGPGYSVYLKPTDGGPAVRLGEGSGSSLSPDGKTVASVMVGGEARVALLPTGVGPSRTLPVQGLASVGEARWYPDGQSLLISGNRNGEAVRLWRLPLSGGAAEPVTPEGTAFGQLAKFVVSPDGRTVATPHPDGGVALFPLDGGAPRRLAGTEKGVPLAFVPDGTSLLIGRREENRLELLRFELASGAMKVVSKREDADSLVGGGDAAVIHLTPDGRTFCYSYTSNPSTLFAVDGLVR